jgi:uncharacterized membrane protein
MGWWWALLLTAPALLIVMAALFGEGSVVDLVVRKAFAPICHQIADRGILVGSSHLVVCARCTGFYGGLAAAGLATAAAGSLGQRRRMPSAWFLLIVPLVADGMANLLGVWATPAAVRAAIGLIAAVPLATALTGIRHATI